MVILHYNSIESIEEIAKNQLFKAYLTNADNFIYSVIHIVEDAAIIPSPEFKFILSLFPPHVEHQVYNRQYRNSGDELGSLLNLSAQVQLVSNLSKFFPQCMPNLEEKHYDFIKNFVGQTQAIDVLFPERKVRAYKKCTEMVLWPKKSLGFRSVYDIKKEKKVELLEAPVLLEEELELDAHIK